MASRTKVASGVESSSERQRALKKNKLFRRIEADIKERDKRRIPGRSEAYIDQSRGISVNIGPSDIRTSMLKQRTFLSKTYVFMQEEQQGYKVFVEQAAHEMHRGAFDRALSYLNKAIRLNSDDPASLIERACCLNHLQKFDDALKDTNRALKKLRRPIAKALYVHGDALYNLGDFEHALMFYYRAQKRVASNNEDELVRNRINRAIKAIDNAIGVGATGHFLSMPAVLNKVPRDIFGMPWHELKALHKDQKKSGMKMTAKQKKHQRSLLGRLSQDLEFLEGLLTDVKLDIPPSSPEKETNSDQAATTADPSLPVEITTQDKVSKKTQEAISFLKDRQEFWSQFKPLYSK